MSSCRRRHELRTPWSAARVAASSAGSRFGQSWSMAAAIRPARRPASTASARPDGDGVKRLRDPRQRMADRVREQRVRHQEVEHAAGPMAVGVQVAVGDVRLADPEQGAPVRFAVLGGGGVLREVGVDEPGEELRPLDEPAEPQEMPPVVAVHAADGDAAEGPDGVLGAAVEGVRLVVPDGLDADIADVQVRQVEAGPHPDTEDVADLPGILARGREAVSDRIRIVGLEGQVVGHRVGIGQHEVLVLLAGCQESAQGRPVYGPVEAPPALVDLLDRPVLHSLELVREEAAAVPRPLQIAADPVEALGVARQHAVRRTGPRGPCRRRPGSN